MYKQVEKPKENKSRAVANPVTRKINGIKQREKYSKEYHQYHIQKKEKDLTKDSKQRPENLFRSASLRNSPIMQAKRTNKEPTTKDIEFIEENKQDLKGYKETDGKENWSQAKKEYDTTKTKTDQKLTTLDSRLKALGKENEESTTIKANSIENVVKSENTFNELYSTKIEEGSDGKYNIGSQGLATKEEKKARDNDKGKKYNNTSYYGTADVKEGTIDVDWSFKADDEAPSDEKLNLNKILWLQYEAALAKDSNNEMEDITNEPRKTLNEIRVNVIINETTNRLLYMAQENEDEEDEDKTYVPTDEEFAVAVGSPSGIASYWLLYEQAYLLNKTYASIYADGVSNLTIKYKKYKE